MPTLVTERLLLAPLEEGDAPRLLEYRAGCPFQEWSPTTVQDARLFIEIASGLPLATPGLWSQLGLRLRDSGLLIGDVGVRASADEPRQAELGITLAPEHQGRGFAREALMAVLDHLFCALGLHRVYASVDPRNDRSIALFERLGMRREAHFRESLWFQGEWADDVVFALLESEWKAR